MCAVVTMGCLAASYPVAELPFADDFSYIFTAKVLAETGRLTLNGWASAALGPQAYWGASAIKLFGFSFSVVRLSMVPLAGSTAAMAYLLARRCGLRPGLATLSALTLCLSPLFLPLGVSFMTDVPGVLFCLIALHAIVSAGQARSRHAAIGCILCAVAAVLVGGTVRQIVWVVALAGVPAVAWQARTQPRVVFAATIGWVAVALGAWITLRWYNRQPYAVPEAPLAKAAQAAIRHPTLFIHNAVALVFTLVLAAFPVILASLAAARRRLYVWHGLVVLTVLGLFIAVRHRSPNLPTTFPWIGNIVTVYGVLDFGSWDGGRPPILAGRLPLALSLLTYAALSLGLILVGQTLVGSARRDHVWLRLRAAFERLTPRQWIIATLIAFAAGYFLLLLPRCATNSAYDRYVLPLFPAVSIPLLLIYQASDRGDRPHRLCLAAAWLALAAFALFGIGVTQEVQSLARARVKMADELRQGGVPRIEIDAGAEYVGWTQLEQEGYMNDSRIVNPPGAYRRGMGLTPACHPRYRIVFANAPWKSTEAATSFAPVTYFSYMPPFRRTLQVRRIAQ